MTPTVLPDSRCSAASAAVAVRSCSSITKRPRSGQIVITDDFGQRVQMSADQFAVLIEEARSGRLDEAVAELIAR